MWRRQESEVARRARALIDAIQLVGSKGHDIDGVLDALAKRARSLLGADAAAVLAAAPGNRLVARRPNPLAEPGAFFTIVGRSFDPGSLAREAIDRRAPLVVPDYQHDARVPRDYRALLRRVGASLLTPLYSEDVLEGLLALDWVHPHTPTPDESSYAVGLATMSRPRWSRRPRPAPADRRAGWRDRRTGVAPRAHRARARRARKCYPRRGRYRSFSSTERDA